MEQILITGVAGGLANLVAHRLAENYDVVGVDVRPRKHKEPFPGKFYQVRYQHRRMRDVFRKHDFRVLLHLGRIRNTIGTLQKRFDYNVLGTRNLLELCKEFELRSAVLLSTYHVYGAHQFNHLYIPEENPLRASQIFPQLADAVAFDSVASNFIWRCRQVKTVILRPCNIAGPNIRNAVCTLLRQKLTPTLMGFDPVMQFIHQEDIARAIELVVPTNEHGIYNVAGEGLITYNKAINEVGGRAAPIPHFVAYPFIGALASVGLSFPMHLLDYFKYPTIISDKLFREKFDFRPEHDTIATIRSIRR